MIAGLIAFLAAVWFYQSALKVGKPAVNWMIIGGVAFYAAMLVWTYLIMHPLLGRTFENHSFGLGLTIELSGALVGAVAVWKIHRRWLTPPGSTV
jgi:hypothetical protein